MLISLFVSKLRLFKERKNLTLKTCAPDFSTRSMTKLYAKIRGARTISLLDFLKTWQVCDVPAESLSQKVERYFSLLILFVNGQNMVSTGNDVN